MRFGLFDKTRELIKRNKEIAEKGLTIGIPYPFPRLNDKLYGIQKGKVELVTAVSGIAKSKYIRFVYIYNVYKHYMQTNYDVRIFYFPLEDGEVDVMTHLICYRLYERYGLHIGINEIMSKAGPISDDLEQKIDECREFFGHLFDVLYVYDSIATPTGIFNTVYEEVKKYGSEQQTSTGEFKFTIDDDAPHFIAIVDNLSNVEPERGKHGDDHAAIGDLVRVKFRKILAKHCGVTCVVVAQQSAEKEKQQYDNQGRSITDKLVPSIDGLATNKEIIRSAHIAFGLFSPARYQIPTYRNWDINKMGNYFRSLMVMKNNEGETDFQLQLYFDGKIELFKELPPSNDEMAKEKTYLHVQDRKTADAIVRKREYQLFK